MSNRKLWHVALCAIAAFQGQSLVGCSAGDPESTASLEATAATESALASDAASPPEDNPEDPQAAARAGLSLPDWRRRCLARRGEYLVRHVAACGECHTPRKPDGSPDPAKFLAGAVDNFTVAGLGPNGSSVTVSGSNLTPDRKTGLGRWTDAQIKKALLDGIDSEGKALFPIMPYSMLHNITDRDADSIVAYLRTIPAVKNAIPERGFAWAFPSQPIPAAAIPNPVLPVHSPRFASAMRGKYLAGNVGLCMDCHTKHLNGPVPLDVTKMFAGGENFDALNLPPFFPKPILSSNTTPDETGIKHWSALDVARLLKLGKDPAGLSPCPPMPIGPDGAFGGLTIGDAIDIGNYITNLPPIANPLGPLCHEKLASGGG